MSFFGRFLDSVIEYYVEDQFCQPITEHELYTIIAKTKKLPLPLEPAPDHQSSPLRQSALQIAYAITPDTPELEFRSLGHDPSLQGIAGRIHELKHKLILIEDYMGNSHRHYLGKIQESVTQLQDKRLFLARKKVIELRTRYQTLKQYLKRIKTITQLNIKLRNQKEVIKILQRIPNIKKMKLGELKAIKLQQLEAGNRQLQANYQRKLLCLDNLSKYILRVNDQEFQFIISNLKVCLDNYQGPLYLEIIKNYAVITHPTPLHKLLASLLGQRIRSFNDANIEDTGELLGLGQKVASLAVNVHKMIKWHKTNGATPGQHSHGNRHRRLSLDSNYSNVSDEAVELELTDSILLDPPAIKQTFARTLDACLSELLNDHVLTTQMLPRQLYYHLYLVSNIAGICQSFTGSGLPLTATAIKQYQQHRIQQMYSRMGRELLTSVEQERGDWNRLPYHNQFRFKPIDRLLHLIRTLKDSKNFTQIQHVILRRLGGDQAHSQSFVEEQDGLEMLNLRLPSFEKIDYTFEETKLPQNYLSLSTGDVILCQSSLKLLSIYERYIQILWFSPSTELRKEGVDHLLTFTSYLIYHIFTAFLGSSYKRLFYEALNPNAPIEKQYTKKRLTFLYPQLSKFVNQFQTNMEESQSQPKKYKMYGLWRKEIKQIVVNDQGQMLRAKVIATESIKYCLAYLNEIVKHVGMNTEQVSSQLTLLRSSVEEISVLLLTDSSQKMVGLEIQTIKSLFQVIKWHEPFQELKQYVNKIINIIGDSFQRLKSSNRGQVPMQITYRIFVLIWRTLATYSVKSFLENRHNNRRDCKLNFERFIDQLHSSFHSPMDPRLEGIQSAYLVFKSIFGVLLSGEWSECKELLVGTLHKFDYIYSILMSMLESCEVMVGLSTGEKEQLRQEFIDEIADFVKNGA